MTPEISLNDYSQEKKSVIRSEIVAPQSVGIALLVVGTNPEYQSPLFWTIKELEDKPETKKIAGEISIPAETRKIGENRLNNVLGALAEFCDDSSLDYVREHLFLAEGRFLERVINVNGNLVDMSVLFYDGDTSRFFKPFNNSEVDPNAWLDADQISSEPRVRHILRQALDIDQATGLSSEIIELFKSGKNDLKHVVPEDFGTMAKFYRQRESLTDMPVRKPISGDPALS